MNGGQKRLEAVPPLAMERNRFYTGKYISAGDLTDEQSYFLGQVRHSNRIACGFGVVDGFDVGNDPRGDCRDWVTVSPGIAIDQWGRFIALGEQRNVRLPVKRSRQESDEAYGYGRPLPLDTSFLLVARYDEELVDGAPPLVGPSDSPGSALEFGRVRECVRLEAMPLAGISLDFYAGLLAMLPGSRDLPAQHPDAQVVSQAEPVAVPLALIVPHYASEDPASEDLRLDITQRGRPALIQSPANATRIVAVSWQHGGSVPAGSFDRLSLQFSRPLAREGRGLVPEVCEIWSRSPEHERTPLPLAENSPFRLADDNRNLTIALSRSERAKPGDTVFLRLNCDFILDRDDRAVDGSFLGGRLPSGNGTPGGQFESWFKVVGAEGHKQSNGDEDGT